MGSSLGSSFGFGLGCASAAGDSILSVTSFSFWGGSALSAICGFATGLVIGTSFFSTSACFGCSTAEFCPPTSSVDDDGDPEKKISSRTNKENIFLDYTISFRCNK